MPAGRGFANEGQGPHAASLAFTAMSHFKLGDADAAHAALAQVRALPADRASAESSANDADAQAFLKEAEALIEGPPDAQPPAAAPQTPPAATQPRQERTVFVPPQASRGKGPLYRYG